MAEKPATSEVERLVAEHHGAVYGYCYRLTGAQADAEDLCQQTFLAATQKLDQLRHPERERGWLLAIARRCYLKLRRRRVPLSAGSLALEMDQLPQADAFDRLPDEIDEERLQLGINALPDEFKLVLTMFYFEGYSYREIAGELDIAEGTVMSRLSRAKGRLRAWLVQADRQAELPSVVARAR